MPWEVVGADNSFDKNKTLLCIVDYYSGFPTVKKADSVTDDDLGKQPRLYLQNLDSQENYFTCRHELHIRLFRQFYRQVNIQQAITS